MLMKRLLAILIAVTMVASLSACKKHSETTSSDEYEIEYDYEYITNPNSSGDSQTDGNSSGGSQTVGSSKVDGNSSGGSQAGNNSQGKGNGGSSKDDNSLDSYYSKFRGKTVRYATWQDPEFDEDGPVIKAFEKKYGVNVEIDLVGQGIYVNTIAGMIAANNSPDVIFCNNTFPSVLSIMQPLDAAKMDLKDPIWDKGMMNLSTINGKTYLLNAVGSIWNEVDCVFYNKRLLKDNNITTPEDYYKAGKWTFDAMTKVMKDVKALGSDYVGGYLDWEVVLASVGANYYNWSNGKFTNGANQMLTEASKYLATCLKDGLISGLADYQYRDEFIAGKVGIAVTNAYGLKKSGYWSDMKADDIGFTYLPDWDSKTKAKYSALFRGWGLCKGSKEPEAAGAFIRYYLDVNNYDVSSAFINSAAESFFFKLTSGVGAEQKSYCMSQGCAPITGTSFARLGAIAKNDPTQVATAISSLQNTINADVKVLNSFVQQYTSK